MRRLNVIRRIETTHGLDGWSSGLSRFADRVIGGPRRRDTLTGRWLGHPVHPMTVTVPIGCWLGATVLDIVGGRPADHSPGA